MVIQAAVFRASLRSFYGMAERSGVVANTDVTCDDRQESRLVPQGSRGCKMNGIQSADRFDRKWASGMGEDRLSDAHYVTTPDKPLQGEQCCSLLPSCNLSREACAKNGAAGFGKRESGRHPLSLRANGSPRSPSPSSTTATKALDSM